jgi:uracil-DNA glycosylase family 4
MSLDLDPRQRAILQEMGLRVWLPEAAAPVVPAADLAPSVAARAAADVADTSSVALAIENRAREALHMGAKTEKDIEIRVSAPVRMPDTLTGDIAAMDWPTLAQAIAQCQACKLCSGRRAPVFGATEAAPQADWLVLGEPPDDTEERAGTPFAEQAGQLLDNMLKAVGVRRSDAGGSRTASAYVTNVVKCRPGVVRIPEAQELATCEHYLRREVALVQPKVILALGRFAAQTLLRTSVPEVASIPLGKLRGQVYRYQGVPVVVSYHPTYLLRTQPDKARAWADLCLALSTIRTR